MYGVDIFIHTGCDVFDTTQLPNSNCKRYMNVDVIHKLLGHPSKVTTRMRQKT